MTEGAGDERESFGPELDGVVREGAMIAGEFRIEGVLGSGGMGVVVRAATTRGEKVALKFLRPRAEKAAVERFLREARAASRLTSEHVARVLDVGRLDSGVPFLVMELLEGETLRTRLDRSGSLPIPEIADYGLQVCLALADAHAHGVVHRDLKPGNLFLTRTKEGGPLLKVFDFGISKLYEDGDSGITTTGSVLGSPSFASPEQLLAPRTVDARTDIWGLGVTLYQLASGMLPFPGDNPIQSYMLVLSSTPAPLHELRPDAPAGFADAVMRCLEKEPAARHKTVGELARALEPFASARKGTAERAEAILASAKTRPADRDGGRRQSTAPAARGASRRADEPAKARLLSIEPAKSGRGLTRAVLAIASLVIAGAIAWRIMAARQALPEPASASPTVITVFPATLPSAAVAPPAEPPSTSTPAASPSLEPIAPAASVEPPLEPRRAVPTQKETPPPPKRDPRSYR